MLNGSCLCGKVAYQLTGTPIAMYYCHCSTCRKANGSSFATNMMVRSEDFSFVSGQDLLSSFESSPDKRRYFCSACGSPIYSQAEQSKHMVSVRCGTLDEDPAVRPSAHIYVASKAPWFEFCDALPQRPDALT
ncbi:MAG TPA: GFA family protein [Burkholderiaceae bacterium]|nr:GFA family protein [Burkholderiaceae bacterium]